MGKDPFTALGSFGLFVCRVGQQLPRVLVNQARLPTSQSDPAVEQLRTRVFELTAMLQLTQGFRQHFWVLVTFATPLVNAPFQMSLLRIVAKSVG